MTTALCAGMYFGGNQERARMFLEESGSIPTMLSKSQFNRRLHQIDECLWQILFSTLAHIFKKRNATQEYVVDSFPVSACKNIRIKRCRLYRNKKHLGWCASKKEYFYGLRVAVIATTRYEPVEIIFAPGADHDSKIFKAFNLELPESSTLYADSAFTDYQYEDLVAEATGIRFLVTRKSNSKRPHEPWTNFFIGKVRKTIESAFSMITSLFSRSIHAVTARGFELKIFLFILAHSFNLLIRTT